MKSLKYLNQKSNTQFETFCEKLQTLAKNKPTVNKQNHRTSFWQASRVGEQLLKRDYFRFGRSPQIFCGFGHELGKGTEIYEI